MNALHLHTAASLSVLAGQFVAACASTGDPFARPLVLTPTSGVQRWLSQQVARRSAVDGEGICAGLELASLSALEGLLAGSARDDPWQPERLVWAILDAAASEGAALAPLRSHLAANEQRYANALRVARLVRRYADHRPSLLAAWSTDPQAAADALGFDAWQVHLWQALHDRIAAPDPVERRRALAASVADGSITVPWPAVHVFAPRRSTPVQRGLLRALSNRVAVHVWLPDAGPQTSGNALGDALGRAARQASAQWHDLARDVIDTPDAEPTAPTTLGRLQAAVLAGTPVPAPEPDGSIGIHSSHAAGRQVEVLREVLCGLFADDPTLEPRDVVVACPDPTALAPHLVAAFTDPADGGRRWRHPATGLRLQVVEADAAATNRLYALLRDLLTLGATRATSSQLLALAAHPFVARRFGFTTDDLERLEELLTDAAVRWGINTEHRARFGLGDIQQNTWQLGVQRLVLGEAFSDDRLASVGVVSTVDDVSSTDTSLIGALAELVSRITRLVRELSSEGTVTDWVARLRHAVAMLADVPVTEGWQLSQVWSVLEAIEARGAASRARLAPADASALLADAFAGRGVRPAFGTGALVVCSLEALARVPHRVVCLVGLDERSFPRRSLGDGDDLLARSPLPGEPDPGADDRQAVLDAVLAASDHLVVVYQGQSSMTSEPHHPPAGVQELIEAVGVGAVHPASLQSFSPTNFSGTPTSFDAASLSGARAVVSPRTPALDRWHVGHLHRTAPLTEIDIERLCSLLRHPGRFLLRERAGVNPGDDKPPAQGIPLELNHLVQWQIGTAMVAALREGHSLDAVTTDRWLSGELPPRQLGAPTIVSIAEKARRVHHAFDKAVGEARPEAHVLDLDVDGVRLGGRLALRGGVVAESHFGSVQAKHLGEAWVRLLAATVTLERRTDAVVVGARGTHRLAAPPVDVARGFLGDLVDLAGHATERVLPLPPRVAEFWAQQRARGRNPRDHHQQLDKLWGFDADAVWRLWFPRGQSPWALGREPDDPWGVPSEDSQLGALAVRVWEPIRRAQL